jgi:dTDP-4-amino-4,6-dideoxygalactose transaminase
LGTNEEKIVQKVMKSGWLSQGKITEQFEEKMCQITNSKFAIAVNNGTSALICALIAHNIGKNDEVILPSFTFVATVNAVIAVGAKPILVDCDPLTFNTTPEIMNEKITKKTKAIIPVDVSGMPVNINSFRKFAKEKNLILIEDAAEALGAEYKNKKIGSFGHSTIFSFHMAKIVTGVEGGIITTNDREIAKKAKLIRSHGDLGGYNSICFGLNFRISDIHSAIALEQLKKLGDYLKHRNQLVKIYKEELKEFEFQKIPKYVTLHPFMLFGLILKPKIRNKVNQFLNDNRIETRICWRPIHLQKYFQTNEKYNLPFSEQIFSKIINLPMGNGLSEKEVLKVAYNVKKSIKS